MTRARSAHFSQTHYCHQLIARLRPSLRSRYLLPAAYNSSLFYACYSPLHSITLLAPTPHCPKERNETFFATVQLTSLQGTFAAPVFPSHRPHLPLSTTLLFSARIPSFPRPKALLTSSVASSPLARKTRTHSASATRVALRPPTLRNTKTDHQNAEIFGPLSPRRSSLPAYALPTTRTLSSRSASRASYVFTSLCSPFS